MPRLLTLVLGMAITGPLGATAPPISRPTALDGGSSKLPNVAAAKQELANATMLQGQIWSQAVGTCQEVPQPATMLLLPSLNAMIDITTTRTMAAQIHPPPIIFILLSVLELASSLLVGYSLAGSESRSWNHMLAFALMLAATVCIILDLEYPRQGLIRVDAVDQVLVELRNSMK